MHINDKKILIIAKDYAYENVTNHNYFNYNVYSEDASNEFFSV